MVDGDCTDAFNPLRELLARHLERGSTSAPRWRWSTTASWSPTCGAVRPAPGVPWTRDTLVQVWSVTKTMAALTALVLADRGRDRPRRAGRDVLAGVRRGGQGRRHRGPGARATPAACPAGAGRSGRRPARPRAERGLARRGGALVRAGQRPAYQILDHGHLLDGIVRGATGRPLADVFRDEVAGPLGADFHLGVPEDRLDDCADLLPPPRSSVDYSQLPPDHFLLRTIANPFLTMPVCNGEAWRRGAVGGAGGHGNARGVARAQAVVSHGGELDGVRLLGAATIDRIFDVQADGADLVLDAAARLRHRLRAAHAVRTRRPAGPHRAGGPATAAPSSSTTSTAVRRSPTRPTSSSSTWSRRPAPTPT